MTKTVSLKELRPRLPKIMDAIDRKMDRFVVTRRGQPLAAIISIDDFEGLLETLEILQDKALVKRLRKAEREVKQGKTTSLEEIHRKLGLV